MRAGNLRDLERGAWILGPSAWVRAEGRVLRRTLDAVFSALSGEPLATPPLVLALVEVERGLEQLRVNGVPIASTRAPFELAPLIEGALVSSVVRGRRDGVAFHAAALEVEGATLLLPGGKGSGKSTVAATLGFEGARYLGDELAVVRYEDAYLEPFPKAATIKEGAFELFRETATFFEPVRGPIRYLLPPSVGGREARPVDLIVFPTWSEEQDGVVVERLAPEACALGLIQQCFGGLERDRRALSLVCRLARAPAYRVTYADARRVRPELERLAREAGSELPALAVGGSGLEVTSSIGSAGDRVEGRVEEASGVGS